MVARVDLKSDRKKDRLQVIAVHAEADMPPNAAEALMGELRLLADWLGLPHIAIGRRGNFARDLARQLKERRLVRRLGPSRHDQNSPQ